MRNEAIEQERNYIRDKTNGYQMNSYNQQEIWNESGYMKDFTGIRRKVGEEGEHKNGYKF